MVHLRHVCVAASVVLVGSLLVALLFWALVYELGDGISPASVAVHGVNFVVMLADLLLVRNPLSHVLVPMAYSIAYLLFSVLFYAVSGDNIYSASCHNGSISSSVVT